MGREGNQELEARTVKRSAREEEMKRSSESQRERRERRHREETKTEERRRQMQRDFQEELNKLMEAEKVNHLVGVIILNITYVGFFFVAL